MEDSVQERKKMIMRTLKEVTKNRRISNKVIMYLNHNIQLLTVWK